MAQAPDGGGSGPAGSGRYHVLALDFDGTLSEGGPPSAEVLSVLRGCRADGVRVVVVSGRIEAELRVAFPDVDNHVDALVLENGAVLVVGGVSTALAVPVPMALFERCRGHDPSARRGDVLVACRGDVDHLILDDIRELGLECVLVRNRAELMVLPAGVTKGTGLLAALDRLGRSRHDTVSVGDAENDHSLFDAAEIGVAVGNAVASLRQHADVVLERPAGGGVVELVRSGVLIDRRRLVPTRWLVQVGTRADGSPVTIPASGVSILLVGGSGVGKSRLTGVIVEQLTALGYCTVVIDPEGEHAGLDLLPSARVIGGDGAVPPARDLVAQLRDGETVIVDLSHLTSTDAYLHALRSAIRDRRRRCGLPHWVVFDEAQRTSGQALLVETVDGGAGQCLVTWRPELVTSRQLANIDIVIGIGVDADDAAMRLLQEVSRCSRDDVEAAVRGPGTIVARRGHPRLDSVAPRRRATPHFRHEHKYDTTGVDAERRFVFRDAGNTPSGVVAANLVQLEAELVSCPVAVLLHHCGHHDFSRWIGDVFRDAELAVATARAERAVTVAGDQAALDAARAELIDATRTRRAHPPDHSPR